MPTRASLARKTLAVALAAFTSLYPISVFAAPRVKLRGYITARPNAETVAILDDIIHLTLETRFELQNGPPGKSFAAEDLTVELLIEAEGTWTARHQFAADKITCDAKQFEKQIKESAYLEREPGEADNISTALPVRLKVDGEVLLLDENTRRAWVPGSPPTEASAQPAAASVLSEKAPPGTRLVGHQVKYQGMRRPDGFIAASRVELGPPAPPDAYKMPHGINVVRAKDSKTGIDILEFRKGSKVEGRMKVFPVKEVQEYVAQLGDSLLPPSAGMTSRPIEFRFFVVEDASVNAAALPDGTVLVNTGLLGVVENEAQLAFVLSHEIAHALQVHHWREVHETRSKRVLLALAGIAGSYFIGDLALFLGQLGLEAVVNGYQRRLENQADRLGLQNIIERKYDPRQAPRFSQIMIERYGGRSISKIWSDHDSNVMRGSFLTIQIQRQYPQEDFSKAIVDTEAFRAMREAMGPVKVM